MNMQIYKLCFFLLFNVFKDVTTEMGLYRMKRALNLCQVHEGNETILENGRPIRAMTSQMCDFAEPGVSCVFEAEHPKGDEGVREEYQKHGCGECPVNENELPCSLLRSPLRNELKTVCCCKSPACLTTIYRDSEIGWKSTKGGACVSAKYDNFRKPRWEEGACKWEASNAKCFISMKRSQKTDSRSHRNRSHLQLELGCGCPFNSTSQRSQISVQKDVVYHCCNSPNCNQELYRMIGFEWIQNTVLREDEQELFDRIEYEEKRFAHRKYIRNNAYLHPKAVFDSFRTYWTILAAMLVLFVLIFCNPIRMESRPQARISVAKTRDEAEKDDDDLVFGEF